MNNIETFVANLFDNAIDTPTTITIEDAQREIDNAIREGWDVPEGITAEEFQSIWNGFLPHCYYVIDDSPLEGYGEATRYDSMEDAAEVVEENLKYFNAKLATPTICEYDSDDEFTGRFWEYALGKWIEGGFDSAVMDQHGNIIDFDSAVELMDDDIRESLHAEMAPCTNQEFYDAYCKAHELKYGEVFRVC